MSPASAEGAALPEKVTRSPSSRLCRVSSSIDTYHRAQLWLSVELLAGANSPAGTPGLHRRCMGVASSRRRFHLSSCFGGDVGQETLRRIFAIRVCNLIVHQQKSSVKAQSRVLRRMQNVAALRACRPASVAGQGAVSTSWASPKSTKM